MISAGRMWSFERKAEGAQDAEKGVSEEKILYALRQVEGGKKIGDVCREMGVSQQTFYTWKRRYAGLGISELR